MSVEPSNYFYAKFKIGDIVILDDDTKFVAVVIGVLCRSSGKEIEISWTSGGEVRDKWVHEWRLSLAVAPERVGI